MSFPRAESPEHDLMTLKSQLTNLRNHAGYIKELVLDHASLNEHIAGVHIIWSCIDRLRNRLDSPESSGEEAAGDRETEISTPPLVASEPL